MGRTRAEALSRPSGFLFVRDFSACLWCSEATALGSCMRSHPHGVGYLHKGTLNTSVRLAALKRQSLRIFTSSYYIVSTWGVQSEGMGCEMSRREGKGCM